MLCTIGKLSDERFRNREVPSGNFRRFVAASLDNCRDEFRMLDYRRLSRFGGERFGA